MNCSKQFWPTVQHQNVFSCILGQPPGYGQHFMSPAQHTNNLYLQKNNTFQFMELGNEVLATETKPLGITNDRSETWMEPSQRKMLGLGNESSQKQKKITVIDTSAIVYKCLCLSTLDAVYNGDLRCIELPTRFRVILVA